MTELVVVSPLPKLRVVHCSPSQLQPLGVGQTDTPHVAKISTASALFGPMHERRVGVVSFVRDWCD